MTDGFPSPKDSGPDSGNNSGSDAGNNANGVNPLAEASVNRPLGVVVGGSLTQGVEIRLDPEGHTVIEDIKAGTFITIQGDRYRFFGVVTDLELSSADPRVRHTPPDLSDPLIAQIVSGSVAYGTVSVLPNLTMPLVQGGSEAPVAAKTIPAHFSRAFAATDSPRR